MVSKGLMKHLELLCNTRNEAIKKRYGADLPEEVKITPNEVVGFLRRFAKDNPPEREWSEWAWLRLEKYNGNYLISALPQAFQKRSFED